MKWLITILFQLALSAQISPLISMHLPPASGGSLFALIAGGNTCASTAGGAAITSSAITTTGGNLVVIALSEYDLASGTTISDSKGNTWHKLTPQDNTSSHQINTLFYASGATTGTGHTFTATPVSGNSYPVFCVLTFSGALTSPFDQENGTANGPLPTFPGSITPGVANELFVTGFTNGNPSTATANWSVDSGFTILGGVTTAFNFAIGMAYKIKTGGSTTTENMSWNDSTAGGFFIGSTIAAFKP